MKPLAESHPLVLRNPGALPDQMESFPRFRYMGSKFRLLPWIHDTFQELDFETSTDAFSGSGVVSYLLKTMGKQVRANDTLAFPSVLTAATVANSAFLPYDADLMSSGSSAGSLQTNFHLASTRSAKTSHAQ